MFKAMTRNVENLFRPGAASGPASDDVYKAKHERLAATIGAQGSDVVALQEVGDPGALDDLVAHLDGSWHRQLSAMPDPRHIRVGWLSRHPITDAQDIDVFPPHLQPVQSDDQGGTEASMGRGALAITLDVPAGPLILATAHLKSKLLRSRTGASPRRTRTSGPASAPTPCTDARPKPPARGCGSPRRWQTKVRTVP